MSLDGLAVAATAQGNLNFAARLFGAAETVWARAYYSFPPVEHTERKHNVIMTRTQLGEAPYDMLQAEGRAMTLEQAIEYALSGKTE